MIGETLKGRYKVDSTLGKGAMGAVYLAEDRQTGQQVAVKVIASEGAISADTLQRFRREGDALQQLHHPNIVGFVDAFQHNDQYIIVMEYLPQGSLDRLISMGPLPVERARHIALDLCDALTRAHRANIIHRDIKPANILIANDGTPKLTDFGVARLIEKTRMTSTGVRIGTPNYMSPEAWEGEALDAQADIWSLGVVLYEMLTGSVPFEGETIVSVMHKVLNGTLPNIKQKRPEVPNDMARAIRRMLERNKKARFQSVREVGLALERGSRIGLIPEAEQMTQVGTGTKRHSLRPVGIGLLSIALVLLVLGGYQVFANSLRNNLGGAPEPTAVETLLVSSSNVPSAPSSSTQPSSAPAAALTATNRAVLQASRRATEANVNTLVTPVASGTLTRTALLASSTSTPTSTKSSTPRPPAATRTSTLQATPALSSVNATGFVQGCNSATGNYNIHGHINTNYVPSQNYFIQLSNANSSTQFNVAPNNDGVFDFVLPGGLDQFEGWTVNGFTCLKPNPPTASSGGGSGGGGGAESSTPGPGLTTTP